MKSYHAMCSLESSDPTAEVACQVGSALAHLDPAAYEVKGVSVWEVDNDPIPTDEEVLALEEKVVRWIAIGMSLDEGRTASELGPMEPGPNTLRLAREKLEGLRSAW